MQVHKVGARYIGGVCGTFDIGTAARANEQRAIQVEFCLEAESLTLIGYQLINAKRVHNICTGGATQFFRTMLDPVQQLPSFCQVVFFDPPTSYVYPAIATPLARTDSDAAIGETGEGCSQRPLKFGCLIALAHHQLETQGNVVPTSHISILNNASCSAVRLLPARRTPSRNSMPAFLPRASSTISGLCSPTSLPLLPPKRRTLADLLALAYVSTFTRKPCSRSCK